MAVQTSVLAKNIPKVEVLDKQTHKGSTFQNLRGPFLRGKNHIRKKINGQTS